MGPESLLPCVEVPPAGPVKSAVIWMHGLGADGNDFESIVPSLGLEDLGVRFVFPHAPKRAVTLNMGLIMRAWYDIRKIDLRWDHDEKGILESTEQIEALIGREKERGLPSRKIVLAGFSQGGSIALHVGLRHPEPLAGVAALSCYLVCGDSLEREISEANRAMPIFQAHGKEDPTVPFEGGQQAHGRLTELGYPVDWNTYPMAHELHPQEVQDLGAWLRRCLDGSAAG